MPTGRSSTSGWGWEKTGPVWGARVYDTKGGQDHLGLGSVSSDRILPALSPGINVLTIHPRYWSFYAWVLSSFWAHEELKRSKVAFQGFYRPREALFSMACQVCDAPEHATISGNVVGSLRVRRLRDDQAFDPQYNYIKEPLGGYGLYYRSTMEAMGLLVIGGRGSGFPVDAPWPTGRALGAAYGSAVETTRLGAQLAADQIPDSVPRDELLEFARAGCLCQLRVADNHDLPLLQDLFLHWGNPAETPARLATLRFLLDLSQSAQGEGLEQDNFRQLAYFRRTDAGTYRPRADLKAVARRWRVYQAREYFSFALNRLFGWVVRKGLEESDDGLSLVPLSRLWELIDEALDTSDFVKEARLGRRTVRSSTTAARFADILTEHVDVSPGPNAVWERNMDADEHALYDWCRSRVDDSETVVSMIAILLLLYRRLGTPARVSEMEADWDLLRSGESLRVGMLQFFQQLHRKVLAGETLSLVARWIITNFLIIQHERVATAKLPEDTFRVRRIGTQLQFFMQEAPAEFNDSRFVALSTTVHELGFVSSLREPSRKLTPVGRELLRQGDLPGGALEEARSTFEIQSGGTRA